MRRIVYIENEMRTFFVYDTTVCPANCIGPLKVFDFSHGFNACVFMYISTTMHISTFFLSDFALKSITYSKEILYRLKITNLKV